MSRARCLTSRCCAFYDNRGGRGRGRRRLPSSPAAASGALLAVVAAAAAAAVPSSSPSSSSGYSFSEREGRKNAPGRAQLLAQSASSAPPPQLSKTTAAAAQRQQITTQQPPNPPSRIRRAAHAVLGAPLPTPRPIAGAATKKGGGRGDPDLTLSPRYLAKRRRDEIQVRNLRSKIERTVTAGVGGSGSAGPQQRQKLVGELVRDMYATLYGPGLTPRDRQLFLERYGCTGWTEECVEAMLELGRGVDGDGDPRGYVEIGAGNGQWARMLTDRYCEAAAAATSNTATNWERRRFDFVTAYDDMSALPLNPDIYHPGTKPHHDYFFGGGGGSNNKTTPPSAAATAGVRRCDSIPAVLRQWHNRGRILLLVYPSPGSSMAYEAISSYAQICPQNDTVVYVGEGRGGANADDAFFDYLEDFETNGWYLWKVLPVLPFGDKGYEKMFILKRFPETKPEKAT